MVKKYLIRAGLLVAAGIAGMSVGDILFHLRLFHLRNSEIADAKNSEIAHAEYVLMVESWKKNIRSEKLLGILEEHYGVPREASLGYAVGRSLDEKDIQAIPNLYKNDVGPEIAQRNPNIPLRRMQYILSKGLSTSAIDTIAQYNTVEWDGSVELYKNRIFPDVANPYYELNRFRHIRIEADDVIHFIATGKKPRIFLK